MNDCLFCRIIRREVPSRIVFEDEASLAFLDYRPVFKGHSLLVPKEHFETLVDLPKDQLETFFENAQLLSKAVESAMSAEGSFVAINNRVSQSVPHLHVHVVPRRRKDGLRGFFWPRHKYESENEMETVEETIRAAVEKLRK